MKLLDVKKSINTVLKDNFPDVKLYASKVDEGFDSPGFFVQLKPLVHDYETVNYVRVNLLVSIVYYTFEPDEISNLKIADRLLEGFGRTLKVADRKITLENITTGYADSFLQFKFDLNYYSRVDDLNDDDQYDLMEDLRLRQRPNEE